MAKKLNEPLPFKILKQFPQKTWGLCDKCAELKQQIGWNDCCILPIAGGMAVAGEIGMDPAADGYKVSALYAWRRYKEIYSFDPDLSVMLEAQADTEMDIPIEILFQLPYPCVFIQHRDNAGFFVHFEHDVKNSQVELRMWLISEAGDISFPLILHIEKQCTISEAIDKGVEEAMKRTTPDQDFMIQEMLQGIKQHAAELIQYVLYICADNSQREENPEQKKVTRRTDESEKKPKDAFREIRKWDVGYRIGSQIRRMKANSPDQSENADQSEATVRANQKGSKKAPHARRGHWHHYWIGKRETDERKLILKWVAPIFINGDEGDNIATIHPVK